MVIVSNFLFLLKGTLIADEMQVGQAVSFDRTSLLFKGFVDLGKYTPKHQANKLGDHALVFLFQPFCGNWVQAIGAFLSVGCASGDILHHLLLEAIVLLENAGYYVDVVTTDGATWNRSMWKQFGLQTNEQNSCLHPCSYHTVNEISKIDNNITPPARQLYFCSDWSHLIKLLRTLVVSQDELWVSLNYIILPLNISQKLFKLNS